MNKIGLIGYGHWGPNLLRHFLKNPHFQVAAVCDLHESHLEPIKRIDSNIKLTLNADDVIHDKTIDAVAIATPVGTHFHLASQALKNGKHVLIEKPLCTTEDEAKELVFLAENANLTLMIDHTLLWNGAVQKIHDVVVGGELGKVCSFESTRVNLGLFHQDVNVLWDLAPHDFSVINYIFNQDPIHMEASSYSHLNVSLPDTVYLTIHFATDMIAHFNLSWMSPVKMRRVSIGGTEKMLVWDDLHPEEKIKIYNRGITYPAPNQRGIMVPEYRQGEVFSPQISNHDALQRVVEHFGRVIMNKEHSIMDGTEGLRVVRMLANAQEALNINAKKVSRKIEEAQYA